MWNLFKRTFLFILVNALILLTLSLTVNVAAALFGGRGGIDPSIWLVYSVIGFGGALISLAMSRQVAKWSMGVQTIDPDSQHPEERRLVQMVYDLADRAGLPKRPEVGIYDSPEINAFATGPTKSRSLVAVSTGLLRRLDSAAVEGVLGHEITHVANGDMVTMTLLQGLINTMVLMLARVLASLVTSQVEERSRYGMRLVVYYALQFALSLLGSMVVCAFSRWREYRADAGGARLAGPDRMLAGLRALRTVYGESNEERQALAALKISGHSTNTLAALFATHPPLDARIRRLERRRGEKKTESSRMESRGL